MRVTPQFGIVRITGREFTDDVPFLASQAQLPAHLQPGKLTQRTLAHHQLAQAGFEAPPLHDLHVWPQRPRLVTDTTNLHIRIHAGIAALGQVGHHRQFGRGHRLAIGATHHAGCLGDHVDAVAIEHRVQLRIGATAQHDCGVIRPGLLQGLLKSLAHCQHRHQYAHHAGNANDHDQRRPHPLAQRADADPGDRQGLPATPGQPQPQSKQHQQQHYRRPRQLRPDQQARDQHGNQPEPTQK